MTTPEQRARKTIDDLLDAAGWQVQDRAELNLSAGRGVAVREFALKQNPLARADMDLFWLRDESLEDSANLPDPDVLAAEIVEDLRAALEQFAAIAEELEAE